MNERLERAVIVGKNVTIAINLQLIIGALFAVAYLVFIQGEDWWRVLAYCAGGVGLSLLFWFSLPFGLALAFPPSSDRLEFPGARWLVWPVLALATLATILLVLRK